MESKIYLTTHAVIEYVGETFSVNIETLEMTVIESRTVDEDSTIELLETLNQKYPLSSQLHIILDNTRYHYSKAVKDFLLTAHCALTCSGF